MKTATATRQLGSEPAPKGKNPKVSTSAGALAVIPPQSNATSLLVAITKAASDKDVDIDKMERLFKMHQDVVAKEAEAAWNAAMSRAQARVLPVAHNAENTQTKSRYAKLAAINKAVVPIYTEEGLSISFDSDVVANGIRTIAKVSHSQGHTKEYHLDLPLDDKGPQGTVNKTGVHATKSTHSYAQRTLICMIFNVATEDDDGNKAGGKVLDEGARADYESEIEALIDRPSADKLWEKIVAACDKAGDVRAYRELKAKILEKNKSFGAR